MTTENAAAGTTGEKYEPTASQKKLLRLVYIMGLLLVLLFLGLIGGVVWKAMKPKAPAVAQDVTLGLGLKSGDIRSVELDGNTMAITTMGEIIVVDFAKRKVLLREPLAQ